MVGIQDSVTDEQRQKMARQEQDAAMEKSLGKIRNKLIVMSGKGGVGKSSTTVNLAVALSEKGYQVGIMDVDLHGPDIPRMLGLKGNLDLNGDKQLNPAKFSDRLAAVSIESLTPSKDEAIIWRGPIKYSAIRQFIGDVAWGDLDFLLIDAPPGTGDEPLTVAQIIPGAKAVIVTTPQEISLADVRKSINFCKTVKMEIFGLIENMSGFSCPHCGEVIDPFGQGGGEKTARDFGVNFLGRVPFDPTVVSCGDKGEPLRTHHAESAVAKAFDVIADKVGKLG